MVSLHPSVCVRARPDTVPHNVGHKSGHNVCVGWDTVGAVYDDTGTVAVCLCCAPTCRGSLADLHRVSTRSLAPLLAPRSRASFSGAATNPSAIALHLARSAQVPPAGAYCLLLEYHHSCSADTNHNPLHCNTTTRWLCCIYSNSTSYRSQRVAVNFIYIRNLAHWRHQ